MEQAKTESTTIPIEALVTIAQLRTEAAVAVERLLAILDLIEGDPDLESDTDREPEPEHDEDNADGEPTLAAWASIETDDREHDDGETASVTRMG